MVCHGEFLQSESQLVDFSVRRRLRGPPTAIRDSLLASPGDFQEFDGAIRRPLAGTLPGRFSARRRPALRRNPSRLPQRNRAASSAPFEGFFHSGRPFIRGTVLRPRRIFARPEMNEGISARRSGSRPFQVETGAASSLSRQRRSRSPEWFAILEHAVRNSVAFNSDKKRPLAAFATRAGPDKQERGFLRH